MKDFLDLPANIELLLAFVGLICLIIAIAGRLDAKWFTIHDQTLGKRGLFALLGIVCLAPIFTDPRMDVPPGTIQAYAGPVATPTQVKSLERSGWLLCDGSTNNISAYPELFNAIGLSWSSGQALGDDVFKLPDMRGMFLRGYDPNGLLTSSVGSKQSDSLQDHKHFVVALDGALTPTSPRFSQTNLTSAISHDFSPGDGNALRREVDVYQLRPTGLSPSAGLSSSPGGKARTSSETRPVNVVVNFIIKY